LYNLIKFKGDIKMNDSYNRDYIRNKLIDGQNIVFDGEEEYFFILGQFLMYVFSLLGGIHKYSKEFSYLTNPYLPQDVQQLGIRIVRFISKLPIQVFHTNKPPRGIVQSLIKSGELYLYLTVDIFNCTEALFEGIHSENLFIEIYA
jgi:hypothetical protein